MGSLISKIADEIKLHGSYEKYVAWRDQQDIPNLPEPEVIDPDQRVQEAINRLGSASLKAAELLRDFIKSLSVIYPEPKFPSGGVKRIYYLYPDEMDTDQIRDDSCGLGDDKHPAVYSDDGRGQE